MKKGQFSMEYILIFSLVFFAFLIIGTIIAKLSDEHINESHNRKMMAVAKNIADQLYLAQMSGDSYQAKIYIPNQIDDMNYDLHVAEGDLLLLQGSEQSVDLKIPLLTGSLVKGCNLISKKAGVISVAAC
jgi:hypothetical protein